MELIIVSSLLLISLIFNGYLLFKAKKSVKTRENSVQLQEFLADLMAGKKGVFTVQRLNSEDLMYRSPRQSR